MWQYCGMDLGLVEVVDTETYLYIQVQILNAKADHGTLQLATEHELTKYKIRAR